jgi:hypothetical protein
MYSPRIFVTEIAVFDLEAHCTVILQLDSIITYYYTNSLTLPYDFTFKHCSLDLPHLVRLQSCRNGYYQSLMACRYIE